MLEMVIEREGKTLRRGLTTGTCAAAAAKAAVLKEMGQMNDVLEVTLPTGDLVPLEVSPDCCVVKDAGDDPDVTDGARICASVEIVKDGMAEIRIIGGDGVGRVTKPGLEIPVGEAAINPVPRKMIASEVRKVLPTGTSAKVTISVPGGEELAKKTLNHKLGIERGISIIGTTGIVEPWSDDAFMRSLSPQIDIALEAGHTDLVLVPGHIGERNAIRRGIPEDAVVQMGNYVGYMLEECTRKGITKVLLMGHQGKLVKVADGAFNTHSKISPVKMDIIAEGVRSLGGDDETLQKVMDSRTTEEALEVVRGAGHIRAYDTIAEDVSKAAQRHVKGKLKVSTVILDLTGDIIGASRSARRSRWEGYMW